MSNSSDDVETMSNSSDDVETMSNSSDDVERTTSNTTSTSHMDINLLAAYQAAVIIWKTWPPCLLLIGGFGNVATIFVMGRIKDHNSSQNILLISLAVSDLSLLYMGAVREWLIVVFGVDVRLLHIAVCKVHVWGVYSLGTSSAWLVTCVTVQRTMAVLWPHRMKAAWTARRTWMVVAAVVLTSFLFQIHLVPGIEIVGTRCDGAPGAYLDFFRNVYFWMDTCASSLFPSVCLLICDVILSLTLFQAASSSSSSSSSMAVHATSNVDSRRKTASRTTVMVLALSCTFLILTMPVCLCLLWYAYLPISQDPQTLATEELGYAVTFFLWYANSAVNFFLYCLTGTKFRQEFLSWVQCCSQSASTGRVGEVDSESTGGRKERYKNTH